MSTRPNIDDSLERAFLRTSSQRVRIIQRDTPIIDQGIRDDEVQIIKLNGSIDRLASGIIFSADEYTREANRIGTWYEELARDYSQHTFVFIGTQLEEPIFQHHAQRLADATGYRPGQSYLICPSFTDFQRENFADKNITCCEAKMSDFASFLKSTLGQSYSTKDVISHKTPGYVALFSQKSGSELADLIAEAHCIVPVDRESLHRSVPTHHGGLRNFYYGNSPTWRDVIDSVPAELDSLALIQRAVNSTRKLVVIKGAAGCGKSTSLMQAAMSAASRDRRCFYLNSNERFPKKALPILASDGVETVIFIDDFEWCHESINDFMRNGGQSNLRFIVSERSTGWARIAQNFADTDHIVIPMERISRKDAEKILIKLRDYGPWGRLSKMSHQQRVGELYERSTRQLLVGLKEATQGVGFEQIIKDEYRQISGKRELIAVHVCAIATMHRLGLSRSTFDAIMKATCGQIEYDRTRNLEGILVENGGTLTLRHAVIADYLVRNVMSKRDVEAAIDFILEAMARFQSPLRTHASNLEYQLYSATTNHKFIKSVFSSEQGLRIYRKHEKPFELDGLYWLQYANLEYGLGKRHHGSALNHIRLALQAFPGSFQIIHAFAHMHFGLAASAQTKDEAISLMETASRILEDQISERPDDYYPLVALSNRLRKNRASHPLSPWRRVKLRC